MSLSITEFQVDDVNTISIPTDAILIVSLLIVFALLIYLFKNILDNPANQFVQKLENNSNPELIKEKLEDQLTLDSTIENQKKFEKSNIQKINFLPPSKILGLSSLAVLAIGGASLLGIQAIQKSYKGVNTSQINIKPKNQSTKSLLSMIKIQSSDKDQTNIKKISYIDPLLSTINSSKYNHYYHVKEIQKERFFSF